MPVHEVITNGSALHARMRAHGGCYLGHDRNYYIEYQGGRVTREAIDDALARGFIKLKWPHRPDLQYWVAR